MQRRVHLLKWNSSYMGTVVSLISAGDEKKYCLFDDFICLMKYDLVSSSDIEECLKIKKKKRELNH